MWKKLMSSRLRGESRGSGDGEEAPAVSAPGRGLEVQFDEGRGGLDGGPATEAKAGESGDNEPALIDAVSSWQARRRNQNNVQEANDSNNEQVEEACVGSSDTSKSQGHGIDKVDDEIKTDADPSGPAVAGAPVEHSESLLSERTDSDKKLGRRSTRGVPEFDRKGRPQHPRQRTSQQRQSGSTNASRSSFGVPEVDRKGSPQQPQQRTSRQRQSGSTDASRSSFGTSISTMSEWERKGAPRTRAHQQEEEKREVDDEDGFPSPDIRQQQQHHQSGTTEWERKGTQRQRMHKLEEGKREVEDYSGYTFPEDGPGAWPVQARGDASDGDIDDEGGHDEEAVNEVVAVTSPLPAEKVEHQNERQERLMKEILSEVTTAHVIPSTRTLQNDADTQVNNKNNLYGKGGIRVVIVVIFVVVVVAVAVVVALTSLNSGSGKTDRSHTYSPSMAPTDIPISAELSKGKAFTCITSTEMLQTAVDDYIADNSNDTIVAQTYGWPIGTWCLRGITDLTRLFNLNRNFDARLFNEDINSWDVSSVTSLRMTFSQALSFNKPLDRWNTSSVQVMDSAFELATSFNQPLNTWDVSSVYSMGSMFRGASSFDQDLCPWSEKLSTDARTDDMFRGTQCNTTEGPNLVLPGNSSRNSRPFCFMCPFD